MVEIIQPTSQDVSLFMEKIGHPMYGKTIKKVYPGVFRSRRVFWYTTGCRDDRVIKLRPFDDEGWVELNNLRKVEHSYRFSGTHFQSIQSSCYPDSRCLVIDMPWLGYSFAELGAILDMEILGYSDSSSSEFFFQGFTAPEIRELVERFIHDHLNFAQKYGIIHGDLIQNRIPNNNLVYHPQLRRLFPVDAEALAYLTDETEARFHAQIGRVSEWMYSNFLKT
jgi:hypothetical protein